MPDYFIHSFKKPALGVLPFLFYPRSPVCPSWLRSWGMWSALTFFPAAGAGKLRGSCPGVCEPWAKNALCVSKWFKTGGEWCALWKSCEIESTSICNILLGRSLLVCSAGYGRFPASIAGSVVTQFVALSLHCRLQIHIYNSIDFQGPYKKFLVHTHFLRREKPRLWMLRF